MSDVACTAVRNVHQYGCAEDTTSTSTQCTWPGSEQRDLTGVDVHKRKRHVKQGRILSLPA